MSAPPLKLGYIVIESRKIEAWRQFGEDGLGLHVDQPDAETLVYRIDDHDRRFIIRRGTAEDVVSLGWQTDDLPAMKAHLLGLGRQLSEGDAKETALRAVPEYFAYKGPKGLMMEFCASPRRTNAPLQMKVHDGFHTGDGGLGHAVMTTRFPEKLQREFETLLGARLSDTITDKLGGVEMEFTFLHLNERHHSLAIAATKGTRIDPLKQRIQHIMIEARTLSDVTDAYVRCKELGYSIAMSMGQHPNDHGISFYVVSPSGIEFEMGCETLRIEDEAAWTPQTYRGISKWGHKPEFKQSLGQKLGLLWTGLTSLASKD